MQEHDAHQAHRVTVEDAPDEYDLAHPPPPAAKAATPNGKASAKSAAPPNMSSEESFPALAPAKPRDAASVPAAWGKKPAALATDGPAAGADGHTPSSASSRVSTPASAMASSPAVRGPALPTMAIPGKHKDRIVFNSSQLVPRDQLKKPLSEILRNINARSKAKVQYLAGPGGTHVFEGTGPVDAVRQALRDLANEIGLKVRRLLRAAPAFADARSCPSRSRCQHPCAPSSSVARAAPCKTLRKRRVPGFTFPRSKMRPLRTTIAPWLT